MSANTEGGTPLFFTCFNLDGEYVFFASEKEVPDDPEVIRSIITDQGTASDFAVVGKPLAEKYSVSDKDLVIQYLCDSFKYLTTSAIGKYKLPSIDVSLLCKMIEITSVSNCSAVVEMIKGDTFSLLLDEYVARNKISGKINSSLAYIASLIICILYTEKYPSDIWPDYKSKKYVRSVDISNDYVSIINSSPMDEAGIDLVAKKYQMYIDSLVSNVMNGCNSKYLAECGISSRLAEFISRVLIQDGETFAFKNVWENSRLPVKREDTAFIDTNKEMSDAVKLRANHGASYTGLKHIRKGSVCEDCCGSGIVELRTKGKFLKPSVVLPAYYIFVSDGVSGSSIDIKDRMTTTPAVGAYYSRTAVEQITLDICKIVNDNKLENRYQKLQNYLDETFIQKFYDCWINAIKDGLGEAYNDNPDDYTATFSSVIICSEYAILLKIGNGTFAVSNGKSEKSYFCFNDNCVRDGITGSISRSLEHPDYWNYMIMPSGNISNVLLSSDGADSLLNGRKIPYNNMSIRCDYSETPFFATLMYELSSKSDEEVKTTIEKIVKDASTNAKYLGASTNDDDITIAFASFDRMI